MEDEALIAVKELFSSYQENYNLLININEISFSTDYKSQFAKVYLLACASYFEQKLTSVVLESLSTKDCVLTHSFISKKALARQYHTLFDWKGNNANSFFGLFGDNFRDYVKKEIINNEDLAISIKNFLELGQLRNKLAHDNYAMFVLSLTAEDINEKFNSAQLFISKIPPLMNQYREEIKSNN
jgi:hypothetical protein